MTPGTSWFARVLELLNRWDAAPTGHDRTCAKCGEAVHVPRDYDWRDGDWCNACWQAFGEEARRLLEEAVSSVP